MSDLKSSGNWLERWRYRQDLQKPVERPREIQNNRKNKKEDGILVSQKVLLTWLIESEDIFRPD